MPSEIIISVLAEKVDYESLLRDIYAGIVLKSLVEMNAPITQFAADSCYIAADKMLKARAQKPEEEKKA